MGFLSPYRVIDLTNERGLLAGKTFADLGAEVIQVEPINGSRARQVGPFVKEGTDKGASLYWEAYASNKKGITCNLDSDEGVELLKKLCESADFLFESETPGVMEKRGLSYHHLKKINPRLIYTSITPFGSHGPKADYEASDLTLWASGAALKPNRDGTRPPVRISIPQSYLHASSDAAGAALIAHLERLHSNEGQHVDISVQQSVAQATLSRILNVAIGDLDSERKDYGPFVPPEKMRIIDQSGSGSALGRSKWKVKDGYVEMHLAMGPATGRFSNKFISWIYEDGGIDEKSANLDWTKVPELLTTKQLDWSEIDQIYEKVAEFLKNFTKDELMKVAIKKRLAMAPVYNIADLAKSPHFDERDFWTEVEGRKGRKMRLPGRFANVSANAFEFKRLAPILGEHNSEVYQEDLGISENRLEDLRRKGVI